MPVKRRVDPHRKSLARRIMEQVYWPFEPIPSPWTKSTNKRRAYVNPTRNALERAAEEYFKQKNWPMLTRCAKELEKAA